MEGIIRSRREPDSEIAKRGVFKQMRIWLKKRTMHGTVLFFFRSGVEYYLKSFVNMFGFCRAGSMISIV